MTLMNAADMKKRIAMVNKMRKDYIKSPNYAVELYDIFLQHLNFKSNRIGSYAEFSVDPILEYLSICSKAVDIYPGLFRGRNTDQIQDSLQKSIYSSACTELAGNFLSELIPDNPDSFLLVPIGFLRDIDNGYGGHSCTFIIRKKESKIFVETIDKAGLRPCRQEKEEQLKELPRKGWKNVKSLEICINYTYEIQNTRENIMKLADVLRIGRLHFTNEEKKLVDTNSDERYYMPFKELDMLAEKHYYTNHIARGQYTQGNCNIKNISAALQYLFGTPHETGVILPDGTKAIKMKYNGVTKKQLNRVIMQQIGNHLAKLGFSPHIKESLKEQSIYYEQLKKARSSMSLEEKLQIKKKHAKYLDEHYSHNLKEISFNRIPAASLINYSYDNKFQLSESKKKCIEDLKQLSKIKSSKIKKRRKPCENTIKRSSR